MSLTSSAREALAFAHITGQMPSGIHLDTWSAVRGQCQDGKLLGTLEVLDGVHADKDSELWAAHTALLSAGFTYRPSIAIGGRERRHMTWDRVEDNGTMMRAGYWFSSGRVTIFFSVVAQDLTENRFNSGTKKSGWIPVGV